MLESVICGADSGTAIGIVAAHRTNGFDGWLEATVMHVGAVPAFDFAIAPAGSDSAQALHQLPVPGYPVRCALTIPLIRIGP